MPESVSVDEAARDFEKWVDRVVRSGAPLKLTRDGRPVAPVHDPWDYTD